jgi:hypothetical protein
MIVCLSVCLSSCKKEPEIVQWKGKYSIWYWDEVSSVFYEPGGAIWFTPTPTLENHWYPLKRFSTTEELKLIIDALNDPQQKFLNPDLPGPEKLVIWFLNRYLKKPKTVVINFYLDNDAREFVGPSGKDKRIWKLLHDKEQCENWYGGVPDPNIIYSNEYKAHWDEYREKIKKERETRRKISESNQPE